MNFTEKKIDGQTLYSGKILELHRDRVSLPDGSVSCREIVRHSGGAAVLLIREGCVLLVRQYRYAYGREIYEIPAGKLEQGEDPMQAAARELMEETGYRAELSHLLDIWPSPGYTDEIIHIYLAENAEFVGSRPDEGEFLNVAKIPLRQVLEMMESGEIADAKTVSAIYKYLAVSGK